MQAKREAFQHPLALFLVGRERVAAADPGPLERPLLGVGAAVQAALLGGHVVRALLVGAGPAVRVGVALVLAEEPEEPRPLLKRVAPGLVLAEVLQHRLDLGNEEQLKLLASGQVVELAMLVAYDLGGDGSSVPDLGSDTAEMDMSCSTFS